MEREREYETTRYVSGRLGIWCPICGANINQACKPHRSDLRFRSHNETALGIAPKPVPIPWEAPVLDRTSTRKDAPRPKGFTPKNWVQ